MSIRVSVCITTYNHEEFIAQAIESVLMQQTPFEYEILIGEDQSSDNTRDIVLSYKEKYPNKIVIFLHDYPQDYVRINGRKNFVNNLQNARGEYIALLDGDDYWTDPLKLAKQAAFLDNHPDYSTVFHWADWFENGVMKKRLYGPYEIKEFYTVDDLLEKVILSRRVPQCSGKAYSVNFPSGITKVPMVICRYMSLMPCMEGSVLLTSPWGSTGCIRADAIRARVIYSSTLITITVLRLWLII
jgi:glycosyltransferase involved in cell wall biosynthesis